MRNRPILYGACPALQHGAYSGMTLLPGESEAEFRELLEQIIAEYNINGPSEHAVARKFAQVMWREQHLEIYGYAERAWKRYFEIRSQLMPQSGPSAFEIRSGAEPDPEDVRKGEKAAERQAQKELGSAWLFIELDHVLTFDRLNKELEIAERLSRIKERLLKQLIFIRGVKTVSASSPPATASRSLPAAGSPPLVANNAQALIRAG